MVPRLAVSPTASSPVGLPSAEHLTVKGQVIRTTVNVPADALQVSFPKRCEPLRQANLSTLVRKLIDGLAALTAAFTAGHSING